MEPWNTDSAKPVLKIGGFASDVKGVRSGLGVGKRDLSILSITSATTIIIIIMIASFL